MFRPLLFIVLLIASIQSFCQSFGNEWIDHGKTYYKFPILTTQLCRIPKTTLVAANLGDVPAENFQLWRNGKEVPIYTSQTTGILATDGFIEFAGQPNDGKEENALYLKPEYQPDSRRSLFSDTSWYYLTENVGNNARFVQTANDVASTTLRADSFFYNKQEMLAGAGILEGYAVESGGTWDPEQGAYVGQSPLRSSAFDQGEGFVYYLPFGNADTFRIPASNLRLYPLHDGSLKVTYTASGRSGATKNVLLYMNDSLISKRSLAGYLMMRDTISDIPMSRIENDATTFKFTTNINAETYAHNITFEYPRRFYFNNARVFNFSLIANNNGNHLRISNFQNANTPPVLYDFANSRRYTGLIKGDSSLFLLNPSVTDRNLSLFSAFSGYVLNIAQLTPILFTDYSNPTNQADFIIISNHRLYNYNDHNYIEDYRAYRSSAKGGGYNAKVFDIDALAEQFSFGQRKNPLAIRNFIRFLVSQNNNNPQNIKPKYIFLIGRASIYSSYRYSPSGAAEFLNAVPTFGFPASDNLLASADNSNPIPLVPIGRVSVINGKEIGDYLEKVKEYEALIAAPPTTPQDKAWKKEIVQSVGTGIGENEEFLSAILSNYMRNYSLIISDTLVGANVKTYVNLNNKNFAKEAVEMRDRINNGVGIINYFGHEFGFSFDDPETYTNTNGKYPIFIANGCETSQDAFSLTANRFTYFGISLPERFLLTPKKGAIAFIAGSDYGVPNYLNLFNTEWYRSAARTLNGGSIGAVQQQGLKNAFAITGPSDALNRMNCEQIILHGDPALATFPDTKPDFSTKDDLISVTPFSSVAADSLNIKVKFYNLGRGTRDSVWLEIKRQYPDGRLQTVSKNLIKSKILKNIAGRDSSILFIEDSLTVRMEVKGDFDKGTNYIIATIDPGNEQNEMSETNNEGRKPFEVSDEEIIPVYPYKYAIVNHPPLLLTGSSANAVQEARVYRLQMDTTELFNSPLLYTKDTTSLGGAVRFVPPANQTNGTVYYWRLAPVINGQPVNWRSSSFQYLQGAAPGFGQSHFFQHQKSLFKQISIGNSDRLFHFGNNIQNIFMANAIYGFSGQGQDAQYSVSLNGPRSIMSACVGKSIIFNVVDTVTFTAWKNLDGRFGSAAYCAETRQYNFEFQYDKSASRKKMMDFIDSIPKGMVVTARLVVDPTSYVAGRPVFDSSFAQYWKQDTTLFGPGKSLYHSLYNQGFYNLDSMNKPRTFVFIFRKDDSVHFQPVYKLSDGLYDKINVNAYIPTLDTSGQILSPVFGPAKEWKELQWKGHELQETLSSQNQLQLIGIDKNGKESILKSYLPAEWVNNISDISATQYPWLRLRLVTKNVEKAIPYQLDYWRLFYTPVPDGALSAADYYAMEKPLLVAKRDTLKIKLAFKNISNTLLDSTSVKVRVGDKAGAETTYILSKLKKLSPGDTSIISFSHPTEGMDGSYYAHISVNEELSPMEQHSFNNVAYIPFEVVSTLPISLVDFTATAEQNTVRVGWNTSFESEITTYSLEFGTSNANLKTIATFNATNNGAANTVYTWLHQKPVAGINYYRLKITHKSGNVEFSPIRQVIFGNGPVITIYPNPFNDKIHVVPAGSNQNIQVELININGQRMVTKKCAGPCTIGTQHLPAGIYTIKIENNGTKKTMQFEKL